MFVFVLLWLEEGEVGGSEPSALKRLCADNLLMQRISAAKLVHGKQQILNVRVRAINSA